jgi:DNA-binding NarL/FixJ family response regulator
MDLLNVLIVDDHPLFRKGMRTLLGTTTGIEVIGEASSGMEAVTLAEELQPDLILMDLHMPGMGGIEACRIILDHTPHIRILVVSLLEDDDSVFAALRAGARGYVLKDTAEQDMVRAIEAVGRGEAIFSPAIATRVIDYFSEPRHEAPEDLFPELSNREREILGLLSEGATNQEIANTLAITLKTVRNHVSNIFSKMQVKDRVQAALRAREAGLGTGH